MGTAIYVEYRGYSVELPHGEIIVGRDPSCTLRFNDAAVSRKHVKLVRQGDQVFVEDLGSMNGTYFNGELLMERSPMRDLDAVELGGHQLLLRIAADDAEQHSTRRVTSFRDLGKLNDARRQPTKPMPLATETVPDRRRADRAPVEVKLTYSSTALEVEATTRDLSITGVFVCTEVLDPLGTSCELTIVLDGTPRVLKGIVRRVVDRPRGRQPVGLAVEFVGAGDAERRWIERTILRLACTTTLRRIDIPKPKL